MNVTLVLSGYITDGGGMAGCVMLKACRIITKENVKSSIEKERFLGIFKKQGKAADFLT